ncbi:hypothetical protein TNCV_1653571 [Trichonephila clavipes]|nr:hypothetical protein TNCV_1653571 [Trichonephila clavipes]
MALRNKESAMNKMSRCRTRNLAPVHSRRGRECDCEFRANRTLMRRKEERKKRKETEKEKKKSRGEREDPALHGEKGLVRRLEWKDDERQGR